MTTAITPKKQAELAERMARLGIREDDLEEQFIRGGGAGGQKVNKTSAAVRLIHRPSGLEVRCQLSRSQAVNRFLARRRLVAKLEAQELGRLSTEQQRIAKLKRQKRKRSKRAKEKILAEKRRQSEKKVRRRPPAPTDET